MVYSVYNMVKGRNSRVLSVRLPDDVVERLKVLARQRRQTMSNLLKHIIGEYAARRYSPGRPRGVSRAPDASKPLANSLLVGLERLPSGIVPSPLPEASHVVASQTVEKSLPVGGDSNVSLGVELEPAKIVPSSSPEPSHILSSSSEEKHPELKGHRPCPCGSGKRYRDCCRPKLV